MPELARTLLRRWAVVAWATVAASAFVGTAAGQPAPDPRPGTSLVPDPAPLAGGRSTASRAPARPVTRAAPAPVVVAPRQTVGRATPAPATVVTTPAARATRPAPAARREPRAPARAIPHAPPRDPPLEFVSAAGLVFPGEYPVPRRLAALAVFALVLASASFLALVAQVRREVR
jgi:hypothetical protein